MKVLGIPLFVALCSAAPLTTSLTVDGQFEASHFFWSLRAPGFAFESATLGGSMGFWRVCPLGQPCDVSGTLPLAHANLVIDGTGYFPVDGQLQWSAPSVTFPVRELPSSGRVNFDEPLLLPIAVSGFVTAQRADLSRFTDTFFGTGTMTLTGFFVVPTEPIAVFDATGRFTATLIEESQVVPEPSTSGLVLTGVGLLGGLFIRRRHASA